ncbi:MAG: hypothetical protein EBR86_13630 [Planctomycetia bacterium]|nr:hypothetical protein [Planctomycetia bacterium]
MSEFVAGISVVCFAASYLVALACEASRLLFRSGIRGAAMVAFGAAGLVAHTLFLGWRAAHEPAVPLSSPFDWYLLAAWLLAGGYLWATVANPRTPVGLFLLPVVLGLIAAAEGSSRVPFPQSPATQAWGAVHGVFNLAASVAVAVGGTAGVMWLIQAGRLTRKRAVTPGLRLPSLEKLAGTIASTIPLAATTAAAGFASGLVLNAVNRRHGLLETVPWSDPVIIRLGGLVVWLVVAALVARGVRHRPGAARTTAWLAVASLACLTASILWGILVPSRHGPPRQGAAQQGEAPRPPATGETAVGGAS